MAKGHKKTDLQNLPACAADFIRLGVKKMRYREKIRADVMAELIAHFEDELRDCKNDEEKEQKAQKLIEDFGDVKLLAVLLRRAKKRCRPLWRTIVARTFQTIGILILCLIVYLVWFFTGRPVVTIDYVAELNRAVRPTANDSLNAAPLYNKAVELYEEKSSDETSELLGTKYKEAAAEHKLLIEEWLNNNEEIFDLVIAATHKPHYWQEYQEADGGEGLIHILMPHLAGYRRLVYALRWRAHLRADKGRYEDAFSDIKTSYRFGQHVKGNFVLIEQLVGIAIEALAVQTLRDILSEHKINSSALAVLQKDFEQIIAGEDFVANLEKEKLLAYDEIQRCFTEDRLGSGHLYIPRVTALGDASPLEMDNRVLEIILSPERWLGAAHTLFLHPDKQQTREMADRYYAWATEMLCKIPAQIRAEGIDIEKENMEMIKGNLLLGILTPALGRVNKISYRIRVDVEATLTVMAILRYKRDIGRYPQNLSELVTTSYLKQLPTDSFSDKPLIYKKIEDDFLFYSVGLNFIDDGGQVYHDKEGRPRLWNDESGDAVFWPVRK